MDRLTQPLPVVPVFRTGWKGNCDRSKDTFHSIDAHKFRFPIDNLKSNILLSLRHLTTSKRRKSTVYISGTPSCCHYPFFALRYCVGSIFQRRLRRSQRNIPKENHKLLDANNALCKLQHVDCDRHDSHCHNGDAILMRCMVPVQVLKCQLLHGSFWFILVRVADQTSRWWWHVILGHVRQ